MTLDEFYSMIFRSDDKAEYPIINVFSSIEHRENYREGVNNVDPLFKIGSIYKLSHVLSERFSNANVEHFCSVDADVIDVIIDYNF